ncbi:complement component C3 [Elysia marginata]|uniref:Complement component C3 n=1 Tax=Elysia marginata TaxID=1093978 RepID=A0AAV4GJ48_9GAST|nr:complement component C3 [Elysia marginata]
MKREETRRKILRPGDVGTVTLSGPPHTTVGLVAVDSAVHHMRKNPFTRKAVFDEQLKHDRGCGSGGGRDAANVFESAGLSVMTNAGLEMRAKTVEGCVDKRVKRSTPAVNKAKEICCQEGYQLRNASLELCYFASQELRKVIGSRLCAREFYDCCRDSVHGRQAKDPTSRLTAMEDRVPEELEMTFEEESKALSEIPLRTNFPESWWFEEYNLGPEGKADVDFVLPDSITTWTVQAVGVSLGAGLCVAPPLQVTAFRNFFVQLDLPYSVVRLEQVEARATIYNYLPRTLKVRIALEGDEGICYSGDPGKMTELVRLEVPPHDAGSAYFPIVPLEIGEFAIRVMAFSAWGQDAVEKTLRVEGEGIEKIHTVSVMLDPSGKRFLRNRHSNHSFHLKNEVKVEEKRQNVELDLDLPQEMIPETDSCTVHAMGDLLGPTLQVAIEGVAELLRLPTGCGEQNLIYLAPNVYVTRYLRATRRLSSEVERKALAVIRQGVTRQMTFRKKDFSFATWQHADSSTW